MSHRSLLLVSVLAAGCYGTGDDAIPPEPQPSGEVVEAVDKAKRVMWPLYGEQHVLTADKLAAGELSGDRQTREFIAERNKTAREAAFRDVDQLLQDRLGDGEWTDEKAEQLFRELGEAYKRE